MRWDKNNIQWLFKNSKNVIQSRHGFLKKKKNREYINILLKMSRVYVKLLRENMLEKEKKVKYFK